ncbi:MAG: putative serine esterase [Fibrobacteres bacterium]|nr:putative serine esterase [Fibrobacterota bacterium]
MMQIKWNNLLYSTWPNAWREGLVYTYKPGSGARAVAQYFAVDMSNQSILDPNYGINHNGMEFYNSLYPSQDVLDPFARIDLTDGSVSNPILNKMEIGQTGQLYEKVTKVLDEYYSDWRTNPDRKIDIVAHSQGGLVTRSMIFKKDSPGLDNPANHINSIITLDTPHLGTAIATDASGVPLISDIRNLVYGLKGNLNISGNVKGDTYLGPYHLHAPGIDITINPFGDAVNMLQNFTATDQYLAYPSNYSNPNWSPAQSVMASGQATSGRSEFVTNLKDLGKFPTNHYSGRKIPLTAYFGTTPHLAPELGEKAIAAAYDMCDGTPDNLSYGVFRTAYVVSKAADIVLWIVTGQSNLVTVDIPACWEIVGNELAPFVRRKAIELDDSWGKYSDFVVDEASQKGLGLFSEKSDPFLAIPLAKVNASDPGVPHMDFGHYYDDGTDLKGATAHGLEIAKALDRPPREKLPPSIISLLLN